MRSSDVSTSEGGAEAVTQLPTTLANLLSAMIILIMTFFVSRNIPGLLEIAILQRLPFTPGGRYAITSIVRYILVIVGLAITFSAMASVGRKCNGWRQLLRWV